MQKTIFILLGLFSLNNSYALSADPTSLTPQTSEVSANDMESDMKSGNTSTVEENSILENYNRNAYQMNDTLDKNIVRPVTVWYVDYIPGPLRTGVDNFYSNLRDFVTLGNDILQAQGVSSMQTFMRISLNSTIGILGFIDVASSLGLEDHKNTFGHTLKTYGWENSSYIVLPFLGPSTIRDAIGIFPDVYFNPLWYLSLTKSYYVAIPILVVDGIDTRAQYLGYDQILQTSLDPYTTMRDTYMQAIGEAEPQNKNESSSNDESIGQLIDDGSIESKN